MKAKDMRQLSPEELERRVSELRDALFNAKVKHATGQLENSASLRTTRRDLARALSVSGERRQQG